MILTRVPRGCHDSSRRSQDGMTPNITFSIFYIKAIPLAVQYTTLRMGWLYIWILLCHACTSFARRYCAMATPPWHEAYNYTWGEENKWLESSEAFIASTWQCRQIAFPIARFLGSGVLQARGERGGGAPLEGDRGRASGVKRGGFGGGLGKKWDSSDHRIIYFQPDLLQYKGRYLCRLNNHNAGNLWYRSKNTILILKTLSKLCEALVKLPATLSIEWSLMGRWASRLVNLANHPKSHLSDQHQIEKRIWLLALKVEVLFVQMPHLWSLLYSAPVGADWWGEAFWIQESIDVAFEQSVGWEEAQNNNASSFSKRRGKRKYINFHLLSFQQCHNSYHS